mgnify:CR=1 FL=1
MQSVRLSTAPFVGAATLALAFVWHVHTAAAAPRPLDRDALPATAMCGALWASSELLPCPSDGIDGKKTPISFAVPLPDPELAASLALACGGPVRVAVTFRPLICDGGGGAFSKAPVEVWVRRSDDTDIGVSQPNLNGVCLDDLPAALVGVPLTPSGGESVPAFGEVSVRVTCCVGCGL